MSSERWGTVEERKNNESSTMNDSGDEIDGMNDETFGDGMGEGWESHHFSSLISDGKQLGDLPPEPPARDVQCSNGANISQFEKLGLKDLWESSSSDSHSTTLDSIWSPSTLPHPPPIIDKKPSHSPQSSSRNIVSVQDLEKSLLEGTTDPSSSSQSPPHSPLSSNMLPAPFRNIHSSPSPSPPPPNMGMYPRPPLHPLMFPYPRPPPGFPMLRPHPHQQYIPQGMPPYFPRGPGGMPHPYMPPNIPLMGPPRVIAGFPPRPPLLLHPSQMGPVMVHPDMHRRPHPQHHAHHHYQYPGPMPSKLHEMLCDLKPDGRGFMTKKEKDWVIKVQLIQLHSSNPEIDDYYYQKHIQRKNSRLDKEEGVVRAGDMPLPLTLPPPVADHKEKPRSDFEGSLGKVSVGSVTAPRKTINVTPPTVNDVKKEVLSRKKQALVTIEKMYSVLLELEDYNHIMSGDNEWVEKRRGLCNELLALLELSDDLAVTKENGCFQQIMSFQKGKRLFRRILPFLNEKQSKAALVYFCKNLGPIMKKDTVDKLLPELLPALSGVINICDIADTRLILNLLKPVLVTKYSVTPFFVSYLTVIITKGYQLTSPLETNDWNSLLLEMNSTHQKSKTKSDVLTKLLTPSSS